MVRKGAEKWGAKGLLLCGRRKACLFVCLFGWSDVAVMMLQQVCVCSAVFFAVFLCVSKRERERKGAECFFQSGMT